MIYMIFGHRKFISGLILYIGDHLYDFHSKEIQDGRHFSESDDEKKGRFNTNCHLGAL